MPALTSITAQDLVRWAGNYQARFTLPQLIRRLVSASTQKLTKLRLPSGEEVSRPGYDGVVQVGKANAWCPEGQSVWESSAEKTPAIKAKKDYNKRTKQPGVARSKTTFVFVTPLPWIDREKWCIKKRRTKKWKDVRVFDCSDLAEWLDSVPPVAFWVARLIGKRPANVCDLTAHWENIRDLSDPKLLPEIFLGCRDLEVKAIETWLEQKNAALYVEADSSDEVIDFFAAFALSQPSDKRTAEARTVIVETKEAWRDVCASTSPLILIPSFETDPQLVAEAVRNSHHVLVPTSVGNRPAKDSCKLRRLEAFELERSLEKSRFDSVRAKRVARESGGSSVVLKRLVVSGPPKLPTWASPSVAPKLAPFLLVGSWNDDKTSGSDREVVAQITGLPEAEIQALVQEWSRGNDPLFHKKDQTWRLVSRADSWRWLARYLNQQAADAFAKQFCKVVAVDDPRFELKPQERIMASVLGKKMKHSVAIRKGMVEAFTLLSVSSDATANIQPAPIQVALWKLFEVVFPANVGWQRWASMGEELMLLAEAMPEQFLEVLDRELSKTPSPLAGLFGQEHFFSGNPATGLMWALEILGWNPNYLLSSTLNLAKLSRLDPGGNWNPRPFGVLSDFFHPLFPQTTATSQRRFEVLEQLAQREPDIAWKLLLALLPKGGGISLYNSQPRWRNWSEGWERGNRAQKLVAAEFDLIADRIVNLATGQPERLVELFNHISRFKAAARNRLFDAIRNIDVARLDDAAREKLASSLRGFISDTRRAQNAWWAMPKKVINELNRILERICPADLVLKYRWLFERWPQLPGFSYSSDQKKRDAAVVKARAIALAEIAQAGLPSILRLAEESAAPWAVGVTVANVKLSDNEILPGLLISTKTKLVEFARAFANTRFESKHWRWIASLKVSKWTPEQLASLALAMPFEPKVWDFIAAHSPAASTAYWNQSGGYNRTLTLAENERAIRHWLELKRAGPVIWLLSSILDQQKPDPLLVMQSLEMLMTVDNLKDMRHEAAQGGYQVSQLIDYLHTVAGCDASRVMAIEWNYFPLLLHHTRTRPKQLFAALAEQPAFYVQVLGMIYRRTDERGTKKKKATVEENNLCEQARLLLDEWRLLPGTEANGNIDEQTLRKWIDEARSIAKVEKYQDAADYRIGEMLAHSPAEADGVWPCVSIRKIIEDCRSNELESGIRCERFNEYQPSSTRKPIPEKSYRELADKHRMHAEMLAGRWLRTASVLRDLAESYEGTERRRERDKD